MCVLKAIQRTILEVKLHVTMCVLKAMQRLEHAERLDAETVAQGRGIRGAAGDGRSLDIQLPAASPATVQAQHSRWQLLESMRLTAMMMVTMRD